MCGAVALVALGSVFTNGAGGVEQGSKDDHGTVTAASASAAPGEREADGKPGPHISGCPVFPADNVWNTTVEKLPRAARSDDYVARIGPEKQLHPDFGTANGMPFSVIRETAVKRVRVNFDYHDDSDLGNYPIPPNATVEGGRDSDGDRHVVLIDRERCVLFELFSARPKPDGTWDAAAGVKIDLTGNALRGDGKTSGDAAGLPIFPGLIRYEEVEAGEIRHAIRFTAPKTQKAYVWPARHQASRITDTAFPPLGQRFRLRADFDISGYSKENRVILTALKRYGMLLADNGGPWFLTGAPDARWSVDDLNKLKQVKGSDFEAVDESALQMLVDSGRVDPLELR